MQECRITNDRPYLLVMFINMQNDKFVVLPTSKSPLSCPRYYVLPTQWMCCMCIKDMLCLCLVFVF